MSEGPSGTNIEGDAPVAEPVVETDEATITDDAELERTLGPVGGLRDPDVQYGLGYLLALAGAIGRERAASESH